MLAPRRRRLVPERGVDEAGGQDVHADVRRHLAGEALAERLDAALGRRIDARVLARHAYGDVIPRHVQDQAAPAVRPEMRHGRPAGQHGAAQVHVEHLGQLLARRENPAGPGEDVGPGVVAPDIERRPQAFDRLREGIHACGGADVRRKGLGGAPGLMDGAYHIVRPVGIAAIGHQHVRALAGERLGNGPPDAAGAPSDERPLPLQRAPRLWC